MPTTPMLGAAAVLRPGFDALLPVLTQAQRAHDAEYDAARPHRRKRTVSGAGRPAGPSGDIRVGAAQDGDRDLKPLPRRWRDGALAEG